MTLGARFEWNKCEGSVTIFTLAGLPNGRALYLQGALSTLVSETAIGLDEHS